MATLSFDIDDSIVPILAANCDKNFHRQDGESDEDLIMRSLSESLSQWYRTELLNTAISQAEVNIDAQMTSQPIKIKP